MPIVIITYLERMKTIAVYCGSSSGKNGIYREQAGRLGEFLVKNNIQVVYGGGKVGLMGALADAVLNAGGQITGVIPDFLRTKEVAHGALSELIRVETMHERKAIIADRSDGAIALPGGFGTLDELFEMLTWGQLGLHKKPVGLLNTHGYFSPIIAAIDKMVNEGFLNMANREMVLVSDEMEDLFEQMKNYKALSVPKWF